MHALQEQLPASTALVGLIRWYDRKNKFGYICKGWSSPKSEDTFFHLNDGVTIVNSMNRALFGNRVHGPRRKPKEGDIVIYHLTAGRRDKGPKASPWAYLSDFELIERLANPQPLYRLIGYYTLSQGSKDEKTVELVFWSGLSLDMFYLKYPECQGNLDLIRNYRGNATSVENIHLEVLSANQKDILGARWQPYMPLIQ